MQSHLSAALTILLASGTLLAGAAAAELPSLPQPEPLRLPLDAETAVIVRPARAEYATIAERLASGLQRLTRQRPAVVEDTADPQELGPGPIIVVGNLMDSRIGRRLYLQAYDFTDYSWPSPGGHVVRTIRDPFGTGAHVLMVGGSDAEGVADAVEALLGHVEAQGADLGYLNLVKLGRWGEEIEGYTERFLGGDDSVWTRVGGAGSWNYQIEIALAGIGYLRTGDERYLPVFARELQYWFDHYVLTLREDAPPMTHGFLHKLLIVWDLVRDHPYFTAEERRRIDRQFLYVWRSPEGPDRVAGRTGVRIIRNNHGTRTALDALYGGRFFLRRFGLEDEGQGWMEIAEGYFAPQLESSKPVEDSWGHQWNASLFNTVDYALATGREDYFHSDALRNAAERALMAHSAGSGPRAYLSACAVATGDTGLLSGYPSGQEYGRMCSWMMGHGDEYMRAFCSDEPIEPRKDLLGVTVAPLDELWYETIDDAGFNPGGLFQVTTEREESFDKLSIREGWEADDFYLLLDGISGGHHSYQNGNCVVTLQEDGVVWSVLHGRSLSGSGTVQSHNGVAVALDGSGPGRLHRYARLLYSGDSGEFMAAGAALEGVGEADWQRHIVRRRGEWTLVVDRVVADRRGEVLAERHWHLRGDLAPGDHGLTASAVTGGRYRYLHLDTRGVAPEGMSGLSDRVETVRATARPGEPVEFATLLHVTGRPDAPEGWLRLRALDAACVGDPPAPEGIGRLESLDIVVLRATQQGQWVEMPFAIDEPVAGELFVELLDYTDRGAVRVLLDGREVVERYDHRAPRPVRRLVPLGRGELAAGEHRLRLEVAAEPDEGGKSYIGLGGLVVRPEGAPGADVATPPDQPAFRLTRTAAGGWRIDGGRRPEFVRVGQAGATVITGSGLRTIGTPPDDLPRTFAEALEAPEVRAEGLLPLRPECPAVESPWRELRVGEAPVTAVVPGAGGRVAAGDADGAVAVFDAGGTRLVSARLESEILSLHFVGDDLMVGEDRGALTRLAPDGSQRWQVEIPYVPMPWDYWSEKRSRVREITSADITGDGTPEILISNSDRRVHAFTADGQRLWEAPVEWGIFTAMTPGTFRGEFGLMGGTSRPSIHGRCMIFGADGKLRTTLARPDLVSWSIPSQFRDMRQADLDGDGTPEVINALDTNCRQLVIYREGGEVLWDADMAGAAEAIALRGGGESDGVVVYCGGAAGYVAAFDGSSGERLWACYLGEPTLLLALTDNQRIAAATPSGTVFLLRTDGRLAARVELGAEVSAVVRPGDHRAGNPLLAGTQDGRVVADGGL
ncbi:MAG: PQQ-binding-like beta-propeller repeat protein [Armatimonadota bacterium]|nr:PQQ-binding-like beta-propeller repeat protein [Armatimonadota bacterium]